MAHLGTEPAEGTPDISLAVVQDMPFDVLKTAVVDYPKKPGAEIEL